ncbi:MAG TPA: hypothetical protein PKA06_09855, partial [Gemmatales bacterium]|nr:hypothetical protein [Gemmatales bacterium]
MSDLLDKAQEELNGKKLLFLFDASQCDHSDIHGMMTNDFARGLKTLEEKISAIPQCYIVQASSENQLSWLCPEQGKSIFSHYLCHGLRGGAQVNRPMISIKNLYDYLAEKTMKWSLANRGSPQKPMFLP